MSGAPGRAAMVRRSFASQAEACRMLGSPFTARLLALAAEALDWRCPVGQAVLSWPGDPVADALPLRFAAALHALALSGRSAELAQVYPPRGQVGDEMFWSAVESALERHQRAILANLELSPQTNEVARSGVLVGGFLEVARATGLPLEILELGASAGLNLHWDRFFYDFGATCWGAPDASVRLAPRWSGRAPPVHVAAHVAGRRACDSNPLDPSNQADQLRLRSYIWADQPARRERLEAALLLAAASKVRVDRADAGSWIDARLAETQEGMTRIVFHTIAWQYFSKETQARIETSLERAGRHAADDRPLAWLRFEPEGAGAGAALSVTLWPGGESRALARGDYHGRWVEWLA